MGELPVKKIKFPVSLEKENLPLVILSHLLTWQPLVRLIITLYTVSALQCTFTFPTHAAFNVLTSAIMVSDLRFSSQGNGKHEVQMR